MRSARVGRQTVLFAAAAALFVSGITAAPAYADSENDTAESIEVVEAAVFEEVTDEAVPVDETAVAGKDAPVEEAASEDEPVPIADEAVSETYEPAPETDIEGGTAGVDDATPSK